MMRPTFLLFLLALLATPGAGAALAGPGQHYSERYGYVQPHVRDHRPERPRFWRIPPRRAPHAAHIRPSPRHRIVPGWHLPPRRFYRSRPPVIIVVPPPRHGHRWFW